MIGFPSKCWERDPTPQETSCFKPMGQRPHGSPWENEFELLTRSGDYHCLILGESRRYI